MILEVEENNNESFDCLFEWMKRYCNCDSKDKEDVYTELEFMPGYEFKNLSINSSIDNKNESIIVNIDYKFDSIRNKLKSEGQSNE